jgi:hypothetical protein
MITSTIAFERLRAHTDVKKKFVQRRNMMHSLAYLRTRRPNTAETAFQNYFSLWNVGKISLGSSGGLSTQSTQIQTHMQLSSDHF